MSVLFTGSTGVKFVNALIIKDSARSNYIESVTQQWRKSAPPILSTSHCEFNGIRSCVHARKTIPLAPIHPFTKQIVPSMYQEQGGLEKSGGLGHIVEVGPFSFSDKWRDNYCAKHNQHAKHANARGVWGYAPSGKF